VSFEALSHTRKSKTPTPLIVLAMPNSASIKEFGSACATTQLLVAAERRSPPGGRLACIADGAQAPHIPHAGTPPVKPHGYRCPVV
jgi:hypothetical protein